MFFIIDMSGDCNVREVEERSEVFSDGPLTIVVLLLYLLMLLNFYMNQMNCTC